MTVTFFRALLPAGRHSNTIISTFIWIFQIVFHGANIHICLLLSGVTLTTFGTRHPKRE